jgi:very-short-patch-repair endonuclease
LVVTRRQALQFMSEKALRHLYASGRWQRVHRAIFVAHTGSLTQSQRHWLAVLAATPERGATACLGGISALCAWGLRGIEADAIHVLVPHPRRCQAPAGVRVHRTRVEPQLDGGRQGGPPVSLPGRALVDAAQWARSNREAQLFVAAAFQQRVVNLADVQRAALDQPAVTRRALVLRTAADCAGGSHSLVELEFLALCRRHRLPTPTRQSARVDRQGRRRYVDALFEPWKLIVEIDGAHHLDVAQMWDDTARSNSLELDGYRVLRYPTHVIRTEPARVAAEIRRALRQAGWPGSGGGAGEEQVAFAEVSGQ